MKKQIILLAFFTVGLALVEACSCFTSCGCGGGSFDEVVDYFDFKKMSVEHKKGIGTESLRLKIMPDSISFLALEMRGRHWNGFTPAAYGCSPGESGWAGLKFPVIKINITADQVFNDTLAAGASLNSIFQMATEITFDQQDKIFNQSQLASLDALSSFQPFGAGPAMLFYLVTEKVPQDSANLPFKFTVTLTKSDSTSVAVTTDEIVF